MECDNATFDVKNRILILQMKLENCLRNLAACPDVYRPGFEALVRQTRRELEQLVRSSRPERQVEIDWAASRQLVG